jgi:hypothetical protein
VSRTRCSLSGHPGLVKPSRLLRRLAGFLDCLFRQPSYRCQHLMLNKGVFNVANPYSVPRHATTVSTPHVETSRPQFSKNKWTALGCSSTFGRPYLRVHPVSGSRCHSVRHHHVRTVQQNLCGPVATPAWSL